MDARTVAYQEVVCCENKESVDFSNTAVWDFILLLLVPGKGVHGEALERKNAFNDGVPGKDGPTVCLKKHHFHA